MFIRQCTHNKNGKGHECWALVESHRTAAGPRQRVVAWLGKLDEAGRLGVQQVADGDGASAAQTQLSLFDQREESTPIEPEWVEVDASKVRVENCRQFRAPWPALEIIRHLKLDDFL